VLLSLPTLVVKVVNGSNYYDGINIIGDTVSTGATAPPVIIDATNIGNQTSIEDLHDANKLYIHGITIKTTKPIRDTLRKGGGQLHLGNVAWDVNNCVGITLYRRAIQGVVNSNLVSLSPTIYVFCEQSQSSSYFSGATIHFPAGGCAIGLAFLTAFAFSQADFLTSHITMQLESLVQKLI
jgi:hypothetical protein